MTTHAIESSRILFTRNRLPSPASFRGPEARTLMLVRGRNLAWEHMGSRDRPNRNLTALTTAQMGACGGLRTSQKRAHEGLWPERPSPINHPSPKKLSPFHLQIQKIKRTLQYKVKLWTPTKPHPHSTR